MPSLRTKAEEKLWSEAKKAVKKSKGYHSVNQLHDIDWGLVQKIYQAKKHKHLKNPTMGALEFMDNPQVLQFVRLGDALVVAPFLGYLAYKGNLTKNERTILGGLSLVIAAVNVRNYLKG